MIGRWFASYKRSQTFTRRLEFLADLPRSREFREFRTHVRRACLEGYKKRMRAGLDGHLRPFAPLAPSTLKRRKGKGPPLLPRGLQSRFWTTVDAKWTEPESGRWEFVMAWRGFDADNGQSIPAIHMQGGSRATRRFGRLVNFFTSSGMWRLPKRDASGIDPNMRTDIENWWAAFLKAKP